MSGAAFVFFYNFSEASLSICYMQGGREGEEVNIPESGFWSYQI